MRPRASFAAKLLLAGWLLALVLVGGVSAFLLASRQSQIDDVALSNSDNRAAVARQLLQNLTGTQSAAEADALAAQPSLAAALASPNPAAAVATLFTRSGRITPLAGETLVVTSASGAVLLAEAGPELGTVPRVSDRMASLQAALRAVHAAGVEQLGDGQVSYDVASPVVTGGRVLGAVLYIAPLQVQLQRLESLVQYPPSFILSAAPGQLLRLGDRSAATTPPAIRAGVVAAAPSVHAIYAKPQPRGGDVEVAGSFVAMAAPGGTAPGGYLGVEAPVSDFVGPAGQRASDTTNLVLISSLALVVTALLVLVFVERTVRRPVARLEQGVARIASGDYGTPIEVRSADELGRLARSVNRMAFQTSEHLGEIERARNRLDASLAQLASVSQALTTTTAGVAALHDAVLGAVLAIAGEQSAALLLSRDGDRLRVAAARGVEGHPDVAAWGVDEAVLRGEVARAEAAPEGWDAGGMLAVPMFSQGAVVGAVAVVAPPGASPPADQEPALRIVANAAAAAVDNARLFEQERETVRRLRELDAAKNEFLATVRHELRTPLSAIMGMADLVELGWDRWDDSRRLGGVRDIQVAARNLYDIVETLLDLSVVEGHGVELQRLDVDLASAVRRAVEELGERYRDGLPAQVRVDVPAGLSVSADPVRLGQVLRALLDNAVKFSPDGTPVDVTGARDGDVAVITVRDRGVGIAPEALPRVFEQFFQADSSATRPFGGMGMGLALVQRLVGAHGADIDIASAPGEGTTVTLRWPVTAPPDGAALDLGVDAAALFGETGDEAWQNAMFEDLQRSSAPAPAAPLDGDGAGLHAGSGEGAPAGRPGPGPVQ